MMWNRMRTMGLGVLAGSALALGPVAQGAIFNDEFDGESLDAFWNEDHSSSDANAYAEVSGGYLTMHAESTAEGVQQRRSIIHSDILSDFDFFGNWRGLNVSDLTFEGTGPGDEIVKFGFSDSVGTTFWGADSALYFETRVNGQYTLRGKADHSGNSGNAIVQTFAPDDEGVTDVELGMDATDFSLVVHFSDGTSESYDGAHNLSAGDWGGGDGASSLRFEVEQRDELTSATATIGQVTVIPEPASLGLLGAGALMMLGRRRK